MKNMMGRISCTKSFKLFISTACALAVIATLCGLSLMKSAPVQTQTPANQITVRGTIGCLPWKEYIEVHTMECAYGLEDAAGTYYALHDSNLDQTTLSAVPSGALVSVTGVFTYTEETDYQSIGIIDVSNIMIDAQ
jgi:hypothetical protein